MDYNDILNLLTEKWISLELHHHTSKRASEDFWDLSKKFFPKLFRARIDDMIYKPIPKLKSQRNKKKKDNIPPINLQVVYLNKETDEVTVYQGEKMPVNQFNPRQFQKLYEVASVKVIFQLSMILSEPNVGSISKATEKSKSTLIFLLS